MVFTNLQTIAFFTAADQMAIPQATFAQLSSEGITTVSDLEEFDKAEFKQVAESLSRPPAIPDPANPGNFIRPAPFVLGAKSLKRLQVAAKAVRYYSAVSRELTAGNMHYTNTLKDFDLQWKSLIDRGDETAPDVPKVTRNLKVTRWSEAFDDFVHRVYGTRHAPLAYVTRSDENVATPAPPLLRNKPHSEAHGSIEGEMISRLSHTSPIFRDDNAQIYHYLEEATRSTVYSSSLKPFQRSKNGRGAFLALMSQHAGKDKWEKELKHQEGFMKSRVWKGNSNHSLEKFIDQHRAAYISMEQCSAHVAFQLPNEHTRVRYLLDALQCNDAELQASLAAIRKDDATPAGMRNNFENAVTFLLPSCPVAKKRKTTGGGSNYGAEISSTEARDGTKKSVGKSGVELRYYKKGEYEKLNKEQKDELREYRLKSGTGKKGKRGRSKDDDKDENKDIGSRKEIKRMIASVFREEMKESKKEEQESSNQVDELKKVLIDFAQTGAKVSSTTATSVPDRAQAAATQLQGILKRSKRSED